MVNNANQATRRSPVNQADRAVTPEPNKIGASTPYELMKTVYETGSWSSGNCLRLSYRLNRRIPRISPLEHRVPTRC
jgi:hypothetical protein